MFRSISSRVVKKKKSLNREYSNQDIIQNCLKTYLHSEYGEAMKKFPVTADYQEHTQLLIIQTSSKVIANELILKSRTIAELLKKEGYLVSKIIIK